MFSITQQPKTSTIQPKLEIGKPNDKYEKEADAVADKVVSSGNANGLGPNLQNGPAINMKCAKCEEEEKLQMKPMTDNDSSMNPSEK